MFVYKCNGVLMSSQSLMYVSKSACVCLCIVLCITVCVVCVHAWNIWCLGFWQFRDFTVMLTQHM